MKALTKHLSSLFMVVILFASGVYAQQTRDLQNFRDPGKRGINVFEAPKTTDIPFEGFNIRIGGSNTLQFQGLDHDNSGAVALDRIGSNFNLATSNLDIDVALYDGVRMHLRTYLSSQHHSEAWVKGGYLQIDKLDFIEEGFAAELMEKLTIKVGHMEINYGDNHFRRSDNGQAMHNPFVGNYIMDSFTTEVGGEVLFRNNGLLAMIGLTNGKLNQSVNLPDAGDPKTTVNIVSKLGYDSQINEDLRVRVTGSLYYAKEAARTYVYAGDRAGSRYYTILDGGFRAGRFDPGFRNEMTAIMINPFVKFQGLEFYGVFENSSGKAVAEPDTRTFNQYGAELLYRFGNNENIYLGGRYNMVTGELSSGEDVTIDRFNIGGGWFMTENILTKVEYVSQNYSDFPATDILAGAEFKGFMVEAVISF